MEEHSMFGEILPQVLLSSENFEELSKDDQDGLKSRLSYTKEIVGKVGAWLALAESELMGRDNPRDFLGNIELDIAVVQCQVPQESEISSWLIRTSWLTEWQVEIRDCVPDEVQSMLALETPKMDSSLSEFRDWLRETNENIDSVLNRLTLAKNFELAVGLLIVLDTMLTGLLYGFNRSSFMRFREFSARC
jgi:hypothetical protein